MARIFPLKVKVDSYKSNYSCRFVAPRNDGRKHGGVDRAANVGADVFAVGDGVVVEAAGGFDKYGTSVIVPPMKRVGDFVEMGELIAKVGKQPGGTQLHLEMYDGTESGQFLQPGNLPYKRRGDIIDPTPFMDSWQPK